MRLRKFIVFVLVFAAVYGLVTVDAAYSDLLDVDGQVGLSVRRVNSDYVTLYFFGKTAAVNVKELREDWNDFSGTVVAGLESFAKGTRELLGIEEEERDYSVFHTELL